MPEVADHEIKFGILAHMGGCDVIEATKLGEEFNSPLAVVSAPVQKGSLPSDKSFVEVLTPNVFVSAIKKAEDSNAIVIRMFEAAGKKTTAKIKINGLVKKGAEAVEADILERPIKNTAKLNGEILTVTVPAYSNATVKIG
jgi:alpha-mannosidase